MPGVRCMPRCLVATVMRYMPGVHGVQGVRCLTVTGVHRMTATGLRRMTMTIVHAS